MTSPDSPTPHRYCGRLFTAEELDRIRHLIAAEPRRNRAQLSRVVCDALGWGRPNGRRKDMSCRVAMLRMHRDGLITLPPPQHRNSNRRSYSRRTPATDPAPPLTAPVHQLGELRLDLVAARTESHLWTDSMGAATEPPTGSLSAPPRAAASSTATTPPSSPAKTSGSTPLPKTSDPDSAPDRPNSTPSASANPHSDLSPLRDNSRLNLTTIRPRPYGFDERLRKATWYPAPW